MAQGAKTTITASLDSDVTTYTERGQLIAEFIIKGNFVQAYGFTARCIVGKKRGQRVRVEAYTMMRQWMAQDDRFGVPQMKSRSAMYRLRATRINIAH